MIQKTVSELVQKHAPVGGIKQVYMVACGGSLAAFYPAKVFLETEAREIRVGLYNSNEFVHNLPVALGQNSVVLVCSHGGNTPETVEAARISRERGASTVGLTWAPGSPLTQYADHVLTYSFGNDKDIEFEKPMVELKLVAEILNQVEGYANYDKLIDGTKKIDRIVKNALVHVAHRAEAFAEEYQNDKIIYTMGSGAAYGAAYMQTICIFMEMQWINSNAIHSGEFFHGPFEVTDANLPFILLVGEGKTRPLDERAQTFLKKYASRVEVLDAKELGLSTIDASVVDYFNHSLFNNTLGAFNRALANVRNHPLATRRYMWKVEY